MDNAFYEKHSYSIYKSEQMPFICHRDTNLKSGFVNSANWHENPEFLRCIGGKGEVFSAGEKYSFNKGDIISVNPNSPHSVSSVESVIYDCLIVDYQFCKDNGIDIDSVNFVSQVNDKRAYKLYDEAIKACNNMSPLQSLKARTYVLEFLLYMCENHLQSSQRRQALTAMEEIKNAMIYIRNNYKNAITLKEVADVSGFSVYHFSREFKKVTGLTFVTFLNTVRCEGAARRLRRGKSVTESCFEVGFKDISYFSRTFTKLMGITPSSLLKKTKVR